MGSEMCIRDSISTDCKHPITDMATVAGNYQKLTANQTARVPDKSYRAALLFVKGVEENSIMEEPTVPEQPKN